jgi:ribonuclease Y
MTEKARAVAADETRRVFEEARLALDERIKDVVTRSLQHLSVPTLIESTVSVVRLPSDEMKGRIIGREGRNIRSIEMIAGIDLIVDDTPGTILISCFDPLRREVARMAIERLVEDGRIHPARIEELVEKTRQDMEEMLARVGESTLEELGVHEVSPRLARLLGELRYHTSQGQNLLQHCRETADLAGLMALELGVDPEVPRRAGLFHEISQAIADRPTSPSILASSEMAGRHGESAEVQQAIAAAHPDVHPRHAEGALVRLACRLSRSRLGARKHNLDVFISRMRRMEGLAESFTGVKKAYALRAGRELRVLVESERLNDEQAVLLSRDIAGRIERELEHTGPIKVSVLRETRAMDYAL